MSNYTIAPSILAANFTDLGRDVDSVVSAGADMIHIDIMDHHYVPNLTFGPMVCSALHDYGIAVPFDVHLMASPVDHLVKQFSDAGADYITFHPEATQHIDRTIALIHEFDCKAGIALNPATPLSYLDYIIDKIDLILVMSVNPGFGGQKLIESTYKKISDVRARINASGREIRLEVDGGVNCDNIAKLATAGADTFVSGSVIFNSGNYKKTIDTMKNNLAQITT